MSYRYNNAFVKPGLNTLVAPTPTYTTYYLYSWGSGQFGILGLGNTTNYSSPKQVGSDYGWSDISSSSSANSVLGVKTDGTLWAWGRNFYGELGLGNTTQYSSPKQVGVLTNWRSIATGNFHAVATKTDGTLWAWGYNSSGQLGLNNITNYSSPKQVGSLTNWLKVSCSNNTSFSIKTDGTLWGWGLNTSGQIGLNNTTNYSSPKQIGALTTWSNISCSYYNVYAIKTDGTLWVWGVGLFGCLGLGNTTYYSSPKQLGSLTTWSKAANGGEWAQVAVRTDGTAWSWGYNTTGQLGRGNTTNYSSPVQIGALTTWLTPVASGRTQMMGAIKTDGTLWTWGNNGNGQLGLGNTTNYSSPKQVGLLTNWYKIGGGNDSVVSMVI